MRGQEQAEQVILALLDASGGALEGRTKLYKAFYFAHLYHAQRTGRLLTDWPIVRMPMGPGIGNAELLLNHLRQSGKIVARQTHVGPYPTMVYRLASQETVPIDQDAGISIQLAISFVRDRTAAQLSDISHEYSRSWNSVSDGEEIDVFLDLMTDEEYGEQARLAIQIDRDVAKVFG